MIYVIADGRGHLKIGRATNTAKRLMNLQTGDADKHALVCLVRLRSPINELHMESLFHSSFAAYRCKGGREWYRDVAPIRAWYRALAMGNVVIGLD